MTFGEDAEEAVFAVCLRVVEIEEDDVEGERVLFWRMGEDARGGVTEGLEAALRLSVTALVALVDDVAFGRGEEVTVEA